jgi:hypothetical protein
VLITTLAGVPYAQLGLPPPTVKPPLLLSKFSVKGKIVIALLHCALATWQPIISIHTKTQP